MVASIAPLTSAATSVSYYARDGQAREDDPEHRLASSWYGKGAKALDLAGPVDAEPFQAILEGHVPGTGLRLGSIRKGQHRHRPGIDLVFSAPKSVALEALFEDKAHVVDAHDQAAKETLGWIEERFLETRVFDRATGKRPRVRADHLVAATFRHVASRNHDPQIHTHCVIANMTRTPSSKWRPVDPTSLRRNRNLFGAFYRNVLAARLHDLGLVMVATMIGRVPGFEIAGYDQAFLDEFSSRRREILEHLDRLGLRRTSRAASLAALVTRRRKTHRHIDDLRREWRERAARLRLKAALARFPDDLPYEIEESRSDPTFTASLKAEAEHHAGFGDIANYRVHTAEDEQVFISYQAPVPPTPEQTQQVAASAAYLQEMTALVWAKKSLADNMLSDDMVLADAVALARERDEAAMFKERQDVGEHAPQSMIAAIAACVIRFGAPSNQDHEWALDVLARIEGMTERPDTLYISKIPWHPTISLTVSLAHMRGSDSSDVELARRLMRLTAYPLKEVSNLAFAALFRDPEPRVSWVTAQLALELAIYHRPEIKEDGRRDDRVNQEARKRSLRRALRTLGGDGIAPLTPLPPPWVRTPRQGWNRQFEDELTWTDPDPFFDAQFAASVFQHLPLEAWCQSDIYRPLLQRALKQFVAWTSERLMPSGRERGPDDDLARMIQWTRLLGDLLARAAPYYETEMVRREFLTPFLTDDENGLLVLAPFADRTVVRHVLDASTIPSNTFDLLNDCVERVVRDRVFNPTGYRAGEVHGSELPELIRALLCVAVEKADGAARFVNGDWSQITLIMPLVTRLVTATGWSPFVMEQFLTLCERTGAAYPLNAFAEQANAVLAAVENAKGGWAGTLLPARTAGVVQCLADANFPLQADQARALLRILDALIDLGERRSAALEQTEVFRGIQGALTHQRGR